MWTLQRNNIMWLMTGLVVALVYISNMSFYQRWQTMVTGGGDSWGYYAYLPSALLYHDLPTLQGAIQIREEMHPGSTFEEGGIRRVHEAPGFQDRNVIKYTYGVALLHLPAFCIAHVFTKISGAYPADGFSRPYILALYLSALLYIFMGLYLIGRVLHHYYSDAVAALVILLIALATNLFYFGVINNVMAHPVLFFLWSALISTTHRFYQRPSVWLIIVASFVAGLITVIRPVEAFCILIPCFYGLSTFRDIPSRIQILFTTRKAYVFYGILAGSIAVLPQLWYWHALTGHWLYYSYPGETLNLGDPHVFRGMFGFLNGWLIYSPVMLFGLLGFYMLWKKLRFTAGLFVFIVAAHIYISYSWWNWYYINGFGSRPMVDIYAVMAFPLAACVQSVITSKWKYALFPLWIAFAGLNIFQMYQVEKGIVAPDFMNRAYYFQSFGKTMFTQPMNVALDLNDYQYADIVPVRELASYDFESPEESYHSTARAAHGNRSYLINTADNSTQQKFEIRFEDLNVHALRRNYLMMKMQVFVERQIGGFYEYDTFFIDMMRGDKLVHRQYLRLNNKPGNTGENSIWWGEIQRWYPLTANVRLSNSFGPGDRIVVYPHNAHSQSVVYIDDLQFFLAAR